MIFHDTAWHLAMLELHSERYWTRRGDLEAEPFAYAQELARVSMSIG